jgi:hypothetical protein
VACEVVVAFKPTVAVDIRRTLQVTTPQRAPWSLRIHAVATIQGDGWPEPRSYTFGTVKVGTKTDVAFRVTNFGAQDLVGLTVTLQGPSLEHFELVDDACTGRTLAGGSACAASVRYAPKRPGDHVGGIRFAAPGTCLSPVVGSFYGAAVE